MHNKNATTENGNGDDYAKRDVTAERTMLRSSWNFPEKIYNLRQKLYRKAKDEPNFRFFSLYSLVFREDILWEAWKIVKSKKGAAGIDGVTINAIINSKETPHAYVMDIHDELREKRYKASPVKRVYIPKPDGKERPLGIPTVKDRIVQTAVLIVLDPIFEAKFHDCSFGFRPGKSAHDALKAVKENLQSGRQEVYDVDMQSYFDTIPHDKLLEILNRYITDRSVLKLIRLWLKAPIKDTDGTFKKSDKGTPQGGVISPLLANLYLHVFECEFFSIDGPGTWANARLIRYADDFLIFARFVDSRITIWVSNVLENCAGLTINQAKSKVVNMNEQGVCLDYLGYSFRYDADLYGRKNRYLNIFPSKKSMAREREKIREMTTPSMCFKSAKRVVDEIGTHLRGWVNYFSYGFPKKAMRALDYFVLGRVITHLNRRSQRGFNCPTGKSWYSFLRDLGLPRAVEILDAMR